jgi:hypothetical protein
MDAIAADILLQRAHDYRGWRLHVRCLPCRSYAIVEIHKLPDHLHSKTMAEILSRLRCRRCGSRDQSSIQLRHHLRSLWLLGDERDL